MAFPLKSEREPAHAKGEDMTHEQGRVLTVASPEAEAGLIGLILWHHSAFAEVEGLVTAEDFHTQTLRTIYTAICHVAAKHQTPDVILVAEQLERQNMHTIGD